MRRLGLLAFLFAIPLAGCVPSALDASDPPSTTASTAEALVAPPTAPTVVVDIFTDHCVVRWSAPPEDRELTGWTISSAVTPRGGVPHHIGGGFPEQLSVTSRSVTRSVDESESVGVVAVNAAGESPVGSGFCPLLDPPTS